MLNAQLEHTITTKWPKSQQRAFYHLVCEKRKQIRTLLKRLRNRPS